MEKLGTLKVLMIDKSVIVPNTHKLFILSAKQGFPNPWNQSRIIHIFKSGEKSNPSNYSTTMMNLSLLAKHYDIIIEKKI